MNDPEHALIDINKSIALDPYNAWAYRNKGIYYLLVEQPSEAIRLLEQSFEMDSSVEDIHYYLARAYSENGDAEKACEWWSKRSSWSRHSFPGITPCK